MTTPISVIVPTRDRAGDLSRALESVAAQSFPDFEVIVVDDGSRDGTADRVRREHPGVRLVRLDEARGAAAARNRGVQIAHGEIVAFLDDDDRWSPGYLAAQAAAFEVDPECLVTSTGHVEVDRLGRVSRPDIGPLIAFPSVLVRLLAECPLHTLSLVACRRAAFERFGPFDERLAIVHDLEWYARVARAGGRFAHTPDALVERRVPGGLVTRHRQWYREECAVHRRVFALEPTTRRHRGLIRAWRELFFARIGLATGDPGFATARLGAALAASPAWAARIAVRRLARSLLQPRRAAPQAWANAVSGESA